MNPKTATIFDSHAVYRVVRDDDRQVHARLAICPQVFEGGVRFFDTLRDRVLEGHIDDSAAPSAPDVVFSLRNGQRLVFEYLSYERYLEILSLIDGAPFFSTTEAVQDFYRAMVTPRPTTF